MMRETLRDVLVNLEQRGKLIRVFKSVDISWEVACLVKWMFQAVEEPNRHGLWFENIAGHNIPVVIGALHVSTVDYGHTQGGVPEDKNAPCEKALLHPLAQLKETDAALQEPGWIK